MATPLSRLNASDGMATPRAQEEYERFYSTLGGKPVHQRLATHWARLIELLYAAERWVELVTDPGDHLARTFTPSRPKSPPKASASSKRRAARSRITTGPMSAAS